MITTVQTTYEGRTYEVVADSDKVNEALCSYVQVYRVRKDGSRGMRVQSSHGGPGYTIWSLVRDQVQTAS